MRDDLQFKDDKGSLVSEQQKYQIYLLFWFSFCIIQLIIF